MIEPTTINITVYQGATFKKEWAIYDSEDDSPYNLVGWTARMQIRAKKKSETPMIELTTENGGIVLDTTTDQSTITIYISAEDTASFSSGGVYDLELIDEYRNVTRIMEGTVTLSTEVTR